MSYYESNLAMVRYPGWRIKWIAWLAWMLRVVVHVDGIPFGRDPGGSIPLRSDGHRRPKPSTAVTDRVKPGGSPPVRS